MIYKPQILRILALLLLSIFLYGCGGGSTNSESSDESAAPPALSSVLVVGDSMSTGFNVATPWPDRLTGLLNVPVDNSFSENGVQTDFGLGYIDSAIMSTRPSHVVIFLGTNDAIRGSVSNAISNLQSMVDIANAQNVTVIVATLPVIPRSSSETARADQINDGIRGLAGARIASTRSALGNGDGLFADGVHPNNTGQQIIAETISDAF